MRLMILVLTLVALSGLSCGRVGPGGKMGRPACKEACDINGCMAQLLAVAHEYVKTHHPEWDEAKDGFLFPPRLTDKGKIWELTFVLSDDLLGGVPVFLIDKATLKIVNAYHSE